MAERTPRILLDSVDSTMDEARRQAAQGMRGPLWIVARRQTAGRGRHGRRWLSEPGNLHATLLLGDPGPASALGQLSLVAGLALHDALAPCLPRQAAPDLRIKWPNDLLLGGAKLAGILAESAGPAARPAETVAVGFGVNCRHCPADLPYRATSLAAEGAQVDPLELLDRLDESFAARRRVWNRGAGFASIRADWLARAHGLGAAVSVRLGLPGSPASASLDGVFDGLDPEGRLALRQGDRVRFIAAGDVAWPPAPEQPEGRRHGARV